ncbi:MAG: C4-type zinc ribbon domain-containing protein [Lentisphaeria bacterium]|nr:C4-type zinc ribbon domain-containing protein [Lentisphaeria bacterium]
MNEWMSRLVDLQDLDLRIAKLKEQLAEVPAKRKEAEKQYAAETEALAAAQQAYKEAEVANRRFDGEIAALKERKKNFQSKTAMIKSNEEYRAALQQIEMCDHAIADWEEKQLEAMMQLDDLHRRVRDRQEELAAGKKRAEAILGDLSTRQLNCETAIAELQTKRPPMLEGIPALPLSRYERLLSRWDTGPATPFVVCIDGRNCGRCHIELPNQVVSNARKNNPQGEVGDQDIISCPNCSAMLYVD